MQAVSASRLPLIHMADADSHRNTFKARLAQWNQEHYLVPRHTCPALPAYLNAAITASSTA
jgi:hypothetical protein